MWATLVLFKNKIEREGYVIFHVDNLSLETLYTVCGGVFSPFFCFSWSLDISCRVFKFLYILLFFPLLTVLISHINMCLDWICYKSFGSRIWYFICAQHRHRKSSDLSVICCTHEQSTFLTDIWDYLNGMFIRPNLVQFVWLHLNESLFN